MNDDPDDSTDVDADSSGSQPPPTSVLDGLDAGEFDAETYDVLVGRLATAVTARLQCERDGTASEGTDDDRTDAVWDAVGDVVPELTEPVCRRVLELADREPDAVLVAQVTTRRESDAAERLRAKAVTVLVRAVTDRLDAEPGTDESAAG